MKSELAITITVALLIAKRLQTNPQESLEAALAYLDEFRAFRNKHGSGELATDAAATAELMWPGPKIPSGARCVVDVMLQGPWQARSNLKLDLSRYFSDVVIAYWQGDLSEEDNRYIGSII